MFIRCACGLVLTSTLLGNGYLMIPGIERIGRHGLLMGRIGTSATAVVMVSSWNGMAMRNVHNFELLIKPKEAFRTRINTSAFAPDGRGMVLEFI